MIAHAEDMPEIESATLDTKTQIKVRLNIRPGKASEHQKKLWWAFWARLIAIAQSEFRSGSERERE